MKKYYRLNFTIKDQFVYVTSINISDVENKKYSNAEKLEEKVLNADVEREYAKFPDLMGSSMVHPLASDKLKEVLLQIVPEQQIQFIPVKVSDKIYWLINVLNNIDCFDHEQSEFTTYSSGALRKITKGVIKSDLVEGVDLFRVAGRYVDIFLSERMKKKLEESKIVGLNIIKTDNWERSWDDDK